MVRALIAKELRENIILTVLAMLSLGAAMAFELHTFSSRSPQGVAPFAVMMSVTVTIFAAPLIGLLHGIRVMCDGQSDRWAFLIHRPIPPTVVFDSKFVAALLLYFLATILPLLLAAAWVATPGHMEGPFYVQMLLPGLADFLAGIPWLLAGMLIVIRQGRWLGSRVFVVGAAIAASICTVVAPDFWQALTFIAIAAAVLFLAARWAFVTGGACSPQPRLVRLALGLTLVLGIVEGGTLVLAGIEAYLPPPNPGQPRTRYYVDARGHAVDVEHITETGGSDELPLVTLIPPEPPGLDTSPSYRSEESLGWVNFDGPDQIWVYLCAERRFFLYRWQGELEQLLGTMGPDGYRAADSSPAAPFPSMATSSCGSYGEPMQPHLLPFSSAIYVFDLHHREIDLLFKVPEGQSVVYSAVMANDALAPSKRHPTFFAVRTDVAVHVFNGIREELFSVPIERGKNIGWDICIGRLPAGNQYALLYEQSSFYPNPQISNLAPGLILYDASGHIVDRQQLPLQPPMPPPTSNPLDWIVAALAPPIIPAIVATFAWAQGTLGWATFNPIPNHWAIALFTLPGLVGVILNLCQSRRCALPRPQLVAWAFIGLLLGPTGVLTMLCMVDQTVKVTCPKCGHRRVVTHELCEHCGAGHAPALRDGTEIFA